MMIIVTIMMMMMMMMRRPRQNDQPISFWIKCRISAFGGLSLTVNQLKNHSNILFTDPALKSERPDYKNQHSDICSESLEDLQGCVIVEDEIFWVYIIHLKCLNLLYTDNGTCAHWIADGLI